MRYSSTILELCTWWRWVVRFVPRPLCPWERAPGTHWIGGCMGPWVCLDAVEEIICWSCRESNPRLPARSPSVCRLNYPGCYCHWKLILVGLLRRGIGLPNLLLYTRQEHIKSEQGSILCAGFAFAILEFERSKISHTWDQWYSTFFVRVSPDIISLQLCTPKVVGV
jgi:hypothetical protein